MTEVEISLLIRNYITAAGIVLGGFWAFWKWGFSEWLRKRENIYAIDGELNVDLQENGESILATLTAKWCNKGEINIELEPKLIRIFIYEVEKIKLGPINFDQDFGKPIYKTYPYSNLVKLTLGPKTDSMMQHHFSLESNKSYAVRWELFKKSKTKNDPALFYVRELVFHTSPNKQNQADA